MVSLALRAWAISLVEQPADHRAPRHTASRTGRLQSDRAMVVQPRPDHLILTVQTMPVPDLPQFHPSTTPRHRPAVLPKGQFRG